MEPVIYDSPDANATKDSFFDRFAHLPGEIGSRIPTLDKSLDAYFDRHFAGIITEWDLLTESDLAKFEHRLARVTDEITDLYADRVKTEARVRDLDTLITSLERGQ